MHRLVSKVQMHELNRVRMRFHSNQSFKLINQYSGKTFIHNNILNESWSDVRHNVEVGKTMRGSKSVCSPSLSITREEGGKETQFAKASLSQLHWLTDRLLRN